MATGVGEPPFRSDESVLCPRCGASNPPGTITCQQCGQDLRLVARAVRLRGAASRRARERPEWLLPAVAIVLITLLALLGWWQNDRRQRAEQVALQHYLNGVWASEVGRWDIAAAEFEAAGEFRDAAQRQEQAQASLGQVEERYREALFLRGAGRPWDAAFLLQQVVTVIPDYELAREYLIESRRLMGPMVLFRRMANVLLSDATEVVLATAERGEETTLAQQLAEGVNARVSPDGQWLVYEALDNSRSSLWLAEVATGEQVPLVEASEDSWAQWSPTGSHLLYGWEGAQGWSVFLHGPATGKSRRLLRGADIAAGDFSPQGSWFTLWERRSNQWSLFLGQTESDDAPAKLVERADSIGRVDWADDEAQVAFGHFLDGFWHLYTIEPGAGAPREVTPGVDYAWIVYRPEGDALALWRWDEQVGTLSMSNRAEGQERELLRGPADSWARWSLDGRWLAAGEWNGRSWRLHLWDMLESPDAPVTLADETNEVEAIFAGDSQRLLYRVWRGERWTVTARDLTSGEESVLLADVPSAQARWAPDGEHVLLWWTEAPSDEVPDPVGGTLAVAEAATGRRITLSGELAAAQGAFSRDGSKMALAMQPVGSTASTWVVNPDGTGLLELDPQSYRVYWASAPWEFGPRLPGGIQN